MSPFAILFKVIIAVTVRLLTFAASLFMTIVTLGFLACKRLLESCGVHPILAFTASILVLSVFLALFVRLARRSLWIPLVDYCRSIIPPLLVSLPGLQDARAFRVMVLIISTLTLFSVQLSACLLYLGFRLAFFAIRSVLVPIARRVLSCVVLLLSAFLNGAFTLSKRALFALVFTVSYKTAHYLSPATRLVSAPRLAALTGITAKADKSESSTDARSDEMDLDSDPASASSSAEDHDMDTSEDFSPTDSSATPESSPPTPSSSSGSAPEPGPGTPEDSLPASTDAAPAGPSSSAATSAPQEEEGLEDEDEENAEDAEDEEAQHMDGPEDSSSEEYRFVDDDVDMQPAQPDNAAANTPGSFNPSASDSPSDESPTKDKGKGKARAQEPLDLKSLDKFAFSFKSTGPAFPPKPPAFRLWIRTEPLPANPLMTMGPQEPFVMPTLPVGPIFWSKQ
ncbi:hypothetical protein FS749_000517 [Ceratobasidium sp. UAMH 11750]|nr:hypothetical protein FS749_000517 [Ceratobasidium sp. UAMH 11750]